MRRARPYHPMRDRKTSALGRALSPSSPPAVAFVKSGYIAIVRSEVRSGDGTRSGLLRRVFAAPRTGDALVGARSGLDSLLMKDLSRFGIV